MTDLERAIAFATEAHAGQVDKQGQPLRDNLGRWVPELGEDLKRRYERALARLEDSA